LGSTADRKAASRATAVSMSQKKSALAAAGVNISGLSDKQISQRFYNLDAMLTLNPDSLLNLDAAKVRNSGGKIGGKPCGRTHIAPVYKCHSHYTNGKLNHEGKVAARQMAKKEKAKRIKAKREIGGPADGLSQRAKLARLSEVLANFRHPQYNKGETVIDISGFGSSAAGGEYKFKKIVGVSSDGQRIKVRPHQSTSEQRNEMSKKPDVYDRWVPREFVVSTRAKTAVQDAERVAISEATGRPIPRSRGVTQLPDSAFNRTASTQPKAARTNLTTQRRQQLDSATAIKNPAKRLEALRKLKDDLKSGPNNARTYSRTGGQTTLRRVTQEIEKATAEAEKDQGPTKRGKAQLGRSAPTRVKGAGGMLFSIDSLTV